MNHAPLTAKYRPQSFAHVAGQQSIKTILSRAAAEQKVAPAYLLSGTRGVGKTTIARIFAKALNCAKGPAAEPCNACDQCRKITQGTAVDVVEIDGASNRGIDDAKRLKEAIGYAPMEGRYKVFIIDEAHMLTREAFNALLKTLEEPPPNVTFVLATTEPHKFPVTIVSRCQHFIFKRLTEAELAEHLKGILEHEAVRFDPEAVTLITRRAAGSVRDAMSLLGQVLALGNEQLAVADVRGILGLAGQELFFRIMEAIKGQDCVAVSSILRELLDQGLDLGFFLRELTRVWRNLFMLRQGGKNSLAVLDLPEEEAAKWLEWAPQFALSHIHACWQMTLEGQRRVLNSLEPGMALELLLLNLTFMPRLLGLPQASQQAPKPVPDNMPPSGASPAALQKNPPQASQPADKGGPVGSQSIPPSPMPAVHQQHVEQPKASRAEEEAPQPPGQPESSEPATWEGFLLFCRQSSDQDGQYTQLLRQIKGTLQGKVLTFSPAYQVQYERLLQPDTWAALQTLAQEYWGHDINVELAPPTEQHISPAELRKNIDAHPGVQLLKKELNACMIAVQHTGPNDKK